MFTLRRLRSDTVCRELAVRSDGVSVNLAVARMTGPGGPWPGHFGLEAVAFTAKPAQSPTWFPPLPVRPGGDVLQLSFGTPVAASRAFSDGGGAVLFPEQFSVSSRQSGQAFGVAFLSKLASLFTVQVLPVLDAAELGFDACSASERDEVRAIAFSAHEWGHRASSGMEQSAIVRRRRFASVLSELHADLADLRMLLVGSAGPLAEAAARMLLFDRVVREAWLPRPHAQVDAIAARHLVRLLAGSGALAFGAGGLRVDLAALRECTEAPP